jgi:dipeptidase E
MNNMRFYLSSYKMGNEASKIAGLMPQGNNVIGYVPNAMDFSSAEPVRRAQGIAKEVAELEGLGLKVKMLDLKEYFGKEEELKKELQGLGGLWVRGGNTFVLRQAMKLSGLDKLLVDSKERDFLYAGYSAGVCILAPSLESLQIVDDPKDKPYGQRSELIMEGLGMLEYMILPHYKSDHPESAAVDLEVEYCEKNGIKYKPLRDGEVIIL